MASQRPVHSAAKCGSFYTKDDGAARGLKKPSHLGDGLSTAADIQGVHAHADAICLHVGRVQRELVAKGLTSSC